MLDSIWQLLANYGLDTKEIADGIHSLMQPVVDAEGNVTIKNSYYGTSTTEDGEILGSFNNIAFGLATPDFFFAGTPAEYVTAAYNETSRDWFGLSVPNLYNLVEAGVYEEGKYETDIVKTW
jgi:hypothetical protein